MPVLRIGFFFSFGLRRASPHPVYMHFWFGVCGASFYPVSMYFWFGVASEYIK